MSRIIGQAPEKGQSGDFLTQSSTSGRKVDFIGDTDIGSGTITVPAGGIGTVEVGVQIYDTSIPNSLRVNQNVKPWAGAIVWVYADIFVDNDSNFDYEFGVGPSLSAGQKNMVFSHHNLITPALDESHTAVFVFKNFDSSPHNIYFYGGAKYAITG